MNKNGTYFVDPTLGKLLDQFLAERRESTDGGGWAQITDDDLRALHDVLECLVEMKCEGDADGDRPIEWDLTNRRTHHRMRYRPIPYFHSLDEMPKLDAIQAALNLHHVMTMNYDIAHGDLQHYHNHIEHKLREAREILETEERIHQAHEDSLEHCPQCHPGRLRPQLGGGVKCDNEECDYWFCH